MRSDEVGHYAAVVMTLILLIAGIAMLFMHNERGMELIALAVPSSGVAKSTGRDDTNQP